MSSSAELTPGNTTTRSWSQRVNLTCCSLAVQVTIINYLVLALLSNLVLLAERLFLYAS